MWRLYAVVSFYYGEKIQIYEHPFGRINRLEMFKKIELRRLNGVVSIFVKNSFSFVTSEPLDLMLCNA